MNRELQEQLARAFGLESGDVDDLIGKLRAGTAVDVDTLRRGCLALVDHLREARDARAASDQRLKIAVGADNPGDRIELEADPKLVLEIRGGVPGDRATANTLVNAAPRVTAAEAGLLTVLELPAGR